MADRSADPLQTDGARQAATVGCMSTASLSTPPSTTTPTAAIVNPREVAWANLLRRAIEAPGELDTAYTAFHQYSIANQQFALQQCRQRRIEPAPMATFRVWQERGRMVQAGEKAIALWMPKTIPVYRDAATGARIAADVAKQMPPTQVERTQAVCGFAVANRWFTMSQTEGAAWQDAPPPRGWHADVALPRLGLVERPYTSVDGSVRGTLTAGADGTSTIEVNPAADHPDRARIHLVAAAVLGRDDHGPCVRDDRSARGPEALREAQAAAVTLIVAEVAGIDGQKFSRAHIQDALARAGVEHFSDTEARQVFATADRMVKDGRKA